MLFAGVQMMGLSMALSGIAGWFKHAATVTSLMTVRQPISYRRVVYGNTRVAGVLTYIGLSGSKNEYLHMVLTLAGHQLQSIGAMYFDGNVAQYQTGNYPYYDLETSLGNPSSTSQPFPHLTTAIPAWSSTCLQRGCAAVHVTLKYDTSKYPSGCPGSIAFDVMGKIVYDPRTETNICSSNPALCLRDFLTDSEFGLAADASTIDDSCTIAAANICDELVSISSANQATVGSITHVNVSGGICRLTCSSSQLRVGSELSLSGFSNATFLNGLTVTILDFYDSTHPQFQLAYADYDHGDSGTGTCPTTQNRYSCNGCFDAGQVRGDVIHSLLSSMAGYCVPPGDAWRILAGAYRTPTIILTADDLRGDIKMDTLVSKRDLANGITGTFVSPSNNWQQSNFPPYLNGTYVTADGQKLWQDIQLPFTTDGVMAQRLAKIQLERIRRQKTLTLPCKLSALPLQPGDTVMFTFPTFGFNEKTFEVLQAVVRQDESGQNLYKIGTNASPSQTPNAPLIGVDLILREIDSNVFAFNPATDENTWLNPAPTTVPSLLSVQPVTGLTVTSGPSTAIVRQDGLRQDRLLVQWTEPADQYVTNGGRIEIYCSVHGADIFTLAGIADGADSQFYVLNVVDGTAYDVQVYAVNSAGVTSAPAEVDNVTASDTQTNFGTFVGAYNGSTTYVAGNTVSSGGNIYCAITTTTGHAPPNATYWQLWGPSSLDNILDGSTRFARTAGHSSYRPLSNPLASSDNGTNPVVSVAAFTMQIGDTAVSVSAGSVSATSGDYGKTAFIYYSDPTLAGGSVIYNLTFTRETTIGNSLFFVGSIALPVSGGGSRVGNNDGGTGGQYAKTVRCLPGTYTTTGSWTNPGNGIDDDSSTYATATTSGSSATYVASAYPAFTSWFTANVLNVLHEVTAITGTMLLEYSVNGGSSWTTLRAVTTPDSAPYLSTATIPLNINTANVQVRFTLPGGSGTANAVEYAGTGADDSSSGSQAWSNPTNAQGNQSTNYASSTYGTSNSYSTSHLLKLTNFGFSLPSGSTVTGIQAGILRSSNYIDDGAGNDRYITDLTIALYKAGTIGGNNYASGSNWPTSQGVASYGGSTSLWGVSWAYTDINNSGFGIGIQVGLANDGNKTNAIARVYRASLTVYYTTSGGSSACTTRIYDLAQELTF